MVMLVKFASNLKIYIEIRRYLMEVYIYIYFAEITKVIDKLINKPRYSERLYLKLIICLRCSCYTTAD